MKQKHKLLLNFHEKRVHSTKNISTPRKTRRLSHAYFCSIDTFPDGEDEMKKTEDYHNNGFIENDQAMIYNKT